MSKLEFEKEQKNLEKTFEIIKKLEKESYDQIIEDDKDVIEAKKEYYINAQKLESDDLSYYTENMISKRNNALHINKYNRVLKNMLKRAYFGRIDFKSEDDFLKIYVGLSSIKNENNENLVYDWRSNICSLYYDYEKEKAQYETDNGFINGEITLKRQYQITYDKLQSVIESDLGLNDEVLKDILNEDSSSKMKNIVMSIQKEQNKIIRNLKYKDLIIFGPAGSGKTVVAMHHIAYLLYKKRETISKDNILIFSPNILFSSYISEVLPNLGEENVKITTFNEYFKNEIKFKHEDYSRFLNRTQIEDKITRIKMSDDFMKVINCYIEYLISNFKINNVSIEKTILCSKEELTKLFYEDYKDYKYYDRLEKIFNYMQTKYRRSGFKMKYYNYVSKHFRKILKLDDKFDNVINEMYDNENIKDMILKLFKNVTYDEIKNFKNSDLKYEDMIIVTYFRFMTTYVNVSKDIKYVIVDEAQDYNIMQYKIMKQVFLKANFILLGDFNQTVNLSYEYDSFDGLKSIFNEAMILSLSKSYRNTAEITNFCNDILEIKSENMVERYGSKVDFIKYDSIEKAFEELFKNSLENLTIITDNFSNYKIIETKFKNKKIPYRKYNDTIFNDNKPHIIPAFLAKGLEFNNVIVFSNENLESKKKIYYVAATRALHSLKVIMFK